MLDPSIQWHAVGSACLGVLGALVVEAAELGAFIKQNGHPPWSSRAKERVARSAGAVRKYVSLNVYTLSISLRAFVGAALTYVSALSAPLGPFNALVMGITGYLIVERIISAGKVRDGGQGEYRPPHSVSGQPANQAENEQATDYAEDADAADKGGGT